MKWLSQSGAVFLFCVTIIYTTRSFSLELSDIVGLWNSDTDNENIEFKIDGDLIDYRLGQGRVSATTDRAANFVVAYQGGEYCWYYIAITADGKLRVANRAGQNASSKCLFGSFTRVIPPAGRSKHGSIDDQANALFKSIFDLREGIGDPIRLSDYHSLRDTFHSGDCDGKGAYIEKAARDGAGQVNTERGYFIADESQHVCGYYRSLDVDMYCGSDGQRNCKSDQCIRQCLGLVKDCPGEAGKLVRLALSLFQGLGARVVDSSEDRVDKNVRKSVVVTNEILIVLTITTKDNLMSDLKDFDLTQQPDAIRCTVDLSLSII